jgi:hypothetical protein
VLKFDLDGIQFAVAVFPAVAERAQPRNPHSGRSMDRAPLAVVEALLRRDS